MEFRICNIDIMQTQIIVALITGISAVLGSVIQNLFRTDSRQSIERDLNIAKQLPQNSTARKHLEEDIEHRVEELIWRRKGKTDPITGSLFVITSVGFTAFTFWCVYKAWIESGWYRLLYLVALISLLVAISLLNDLPKYFTKAPRDEHGNIIPISRGDNARDKNSGK